MSRGSRSEEQEPLTEEQREHFRKLLEDRRAKLMAEAEEHAGDLRESGGLRMSDEVDLASAEYEQAFEHRMRDREQGLLKKVDKALKRIEDGTFDECENCGNYIGYNRLSARPEATLCIECKEEQERAEHNIRQRRDTENQFPFK